MSNEETVRYWGQTEAERQSAFQKDAAERAAAGWRVASQRTQFAFGKPGMDLVVSYVSDRAADTADMSDPADARATSTPTPPAHFDLNAAVAAATTPMPDHAQVKAPASVPVPPVRPAPAPAPEPAVEPEPEAAADAEAEAEADDESAPSEPASDSPLSPEASRRLFGPNSDDVLWVLDGLADMDRATAEEIAAAYARADEALHAEATKALTDEFGGPPFGHRMKAAEERVRAWVDAIGAKGNDRALYEAVGCAAMDAVDALIVQDQLVEGTFTVLYDPWGSVMDPPEADTAEDGAEASDDTTSDDHAAEDHAAEEEEAVEEEAAEEEDAAEFGPNTDLVLEFFDALNNVTPAQIDQLVESGTGEWQAKLTASRDRVNEIVSEKERWTEQCDAAIGEVDAWVAGRQGVHFDYRGGETGGLDREAAAPIVGDALTSLVMADLVEREDAENLYSAWKYAVGKPDLPEYSDG